MNGTIVYFSHGGGPLPLLGDPQHVNMNKFMSTLPNQINKPDAIIVFSAHWEENEVKIINSLSPDLYYDYFGFPEEAYQIKYPAPGSPELAERISDLLKVHGIKNSFEAERGIDHGVFIPLKMMYPNADIPVLQISLVKGLDPSEHISIGEAFSELLKSENFLLIGSGFSFHNMREFFNKSEFADKENAKFQDWLIENIAGTKEYPEIKKALQDWESAPAARFCHPREEHLLPLHVCAGTAGKSGELIFDDLILDKRAVAFKW